MGNMVLEHFHGIMCESPVIFQVKPRGVLHVTFMELQIKPMKLQAKSTELRVK